jgi:hypothetical protein
VQFAIRQKLKRPGWDKQQMEISSMGIVLS